MFLGLRQFLNFVTVFPAVENTLSEGVDVAGIDRNTLARQAMLGNRSAFTFHHRSVESLRRDGFSDKNCLSSYGKLLDQDPKSNQEKRFFSS